jgi:hypothetical protein
VSGAAEQPDGKSLPGVEPGDAWTSAARDHRSDGVAELVRADLCAPLCTPPSRNGQDVQVRRWRYRQELWIGPDQAAAFRTFFIPSLLM